MRSRFEENTTRRRLWPVGAGVVLVAATIAYFPLHTWLYEREVRALIPRLDAALVEAERCLAPGERDFDWMELTAAALRMRDYRSHANSCIHAAVTEVRDILSRVPVIDHPASDLARRLSSSLNPERFSIDVGGDCQTMQDLAHAARELATSVGAAAREIPACPEDREVEAIPPPRELPSGTPNSIETRGNELVVSYQLPDSRYFHARWSENAWTSLATPEECTSRTVTFDWRDNIAVAECFIDNDIYSRVFLHRDGRWEVLRDGSVYGFALGSANVLWIIDQDTSHGSEATEWIVRRSADGGRSFSTVGPFVPRTLDNVFHADEDSFVVAGSVDHELATAHFTSIAATEVPPEPMENDGEPSWGATRACMSGHRHWALVDGARLFSSADDGGHWALVYLLGEEFAIDRGDLVCTENEIVVVGLSRHGSSPIEGEPGYDGGLLVHRRCDTQTCFAETIIADRAWHWAAVLSPQGLRIIVDTVLGATDIALFGADGVGGTPSLLATVRPVANTSGLLRIDDVVFAPSVHDIPNEHY